MRKDYLDIAKWNRKEHFEFFNSFDEPFFGATVDIDVTKAKQYCAENNISFFIWYVHKAMIAINRIDEFKYRIEDGNKVRIHPTVNASATISREDQTFAFSYIEFDLDFNIFHQNCQDEIRRIRAGSGLFPPRNDEQCVYFSALPWLPFTSITHARNFEFKDSVPRISFGQLINRDQRLWMPTSVHVHHALMDGYHVGLFVKLFQELLIS